MKPRGLRARRRRGGAGVGVAVGGTADAGAWAQPVAQGAACFCSAPPWFFCKKNNGKRESGAGTAQGIWFAPLWCRHKSGAKVARCMCMGTQPLCPYLGSAKVAHDRRTNTKLAPRSQIWWRKGDVSLRRPAQTTILFSGASASAISLFPAQLSYSSSK